MSFYSIAPMNVLGLIMDYKEQLDETIPCNNCGKSVSNSEIIYITCCDVCYKHLCDDCHGFGFWCQLCND